MLAIPPPPSDDDPFASVPATLATSEPDFEPVDIGKWDSNWEGNWSGKADVFVPDKEGKRKRDLQEEVEWQDGDERAPVLKSEEPLLTKAALNKMKKAELVSYAKARGVSSSGTKKDIVTRLHD
jgi:hypothetical protein